MGKKYSDELKLLPETYKWASEASIDNLLNFVHVCHGRPLLAIGSGGSLTAAHFVARLHNYSSYGMSRYATPLEIFLDKPISKETGVLFLSASGRNKDIIDAAEAAMAAEVPALGVVSMHEDNPLVSRTRAYERTFVFDHSIPSGKDGYLATNSLLATLIILARAYQIPSAQIENSIQIPTVNWHYRDSVTVLHGAWSSPVAHDLESRMHESTLLHTQVADYRNFSHGRHLWFTNRSSTSFILALITPDTVKVAEKTLKLIPNEIPVVQIVTDIAGPYGTIELFMKALYWTLEVARYNNFDPGKPKVASFGRRMFHLAPPKQKPSRNNTIPAPVQRKLDFIKTADTFSTQFYQEAYNKFCLQLTGAEFGAVVLDYDGTLICQQDRFGPLPSKTAETLRCLLEIGLVLGIATGRGGSVRDSLQAGLPQEYWHQIYIGYYNGAEIGPLSCDRLPDKQRFPVPGITKVQELLQLDNYLHKIALIEIRPFQITVTPKSAELHTDLYRYLLDFLIANDCRDLQLLRSSHSLDIIDHKVTKLSIVQQIEDIVAPCSVLCIGDKGAWPGNDALLLSHKYSLSVDEVSSSPISCWNLAPWGCIGPTATLRYLTAIRERHGKVRFNLEYILKGEPL